MSTGQENATSTTCPVCMSSAVTALVRLENITVVCNNLYNDQQSAMAAPRGDLDLTFCSQCGHCFNGTFDEALMDYGENYETSLHFSPKFQVYARALSRRLIETYELNGKAIIEMGCGQGEFLTEICEIGQNKGYGFDQSYDPRQLSPSDNVHIFSENYGEQHAHINADLLVCRHVLEHVGDPAQFLQMLHEAFAESKNGVVYFEVPNGLYTLNDLSIWDLIYEHRSYFWEGSLHHLFETCGFDVIQVYTGYDNQFLSIEARISHINSSPRGESRQIKKDIAQIVGSARAFSQNFQEKKLFWQSARQALAMQKRSCIVWGAGSKGATFLNLTTPKDEDPLAAAYAVDINPRKHGKFLPGSGQKIVPPAALVDLRPDVVFLMNPTYADEVRRELSSLNLDPELQTV